MTGNSLTEAFAFSSPIVCALVCMIMMLLDARTFTRHTEEWKLRRFLALTYLVTALGWLGMVLYSINPRAFIYYHTVFLLTLMLDQVMFYRFVSLITGTGKPRRFNCLHWLIPLLLTAASVVSDLMIPIGQEKLPVLGNEGEESTIWFRIVYIVTTGIFIVYNTLYPALNLRSIRRYKRFVVNYSSEAQRTSLDWLTVIQVLILVGVPVPLAGLLSGIGAFASFWFVWLGALPTFVFYGLLCYNLLDENYLIIQPEAMEEEGLPERAFVAFDRHHFERYLREHQPYLDPSLRITDLATGLNTNRSYLSAFINREYNMNFSRFINRCRLKALDKLRLSPEHIRKTNMELVLMAGFGNYRNYLRVKKEEDKRTLLKFD